jgi:hypothetical protein
MPLRANPLPEIGATGRNQEGIRTATSAFIKPDSGQIDKPFPPL